MIQLEHISKKFKKKTVLNDISYTFETGKIYGIYGINGSGKQCYSVSYPVWFSRLPAQ